MILFYFIFKIGKFKEINLDSQLGILKISKTTSLYVSDFGEVIRGVYDGQPVAIKSFFRKHIRSSELFFINELLNFELIRSQIDDDKASFFVELIGFTLNYKNDPCYGNILTKYYPLGDLSQYTRELSNPEKLKKYDNFDEKKVYLR